VLVALIYVVFFKRRNKSRLLTFKQDIKISNIRLSPPNGSTLKAHDPVVVKFDYNYSDPNTDLHVWAKVLDTKFSSTYEGSMNSMSPGTGTISRYVYLTQPGKIDAINIVVKNQEFEEIYNQRVDTQYVFEKNSELQFLAADGDGSRVVSVSFKPNTPARLPAGTRVTVNIEYEINTEIGLDIWAIPETDGNMTYEGSTGTQSGNGMVSKTFTVSEPGTVNKVTILMHNAAKQAVLSEEIDVDFSYI